MAKTVFTRELVDPITGEVIEAVAFIPEAKDRNFAKVFKVFGEKVLHDLKLINGEAKLLFWFFAKTLDLPVQSDLWIPVTYEMIAKDLKVSERTVRTYLKNLMSLGYIEQFKKRSLVFRVKPEFLYKGVLQKYQDDKIERMILSLRGES